MPIIELRSNGDHLIELIEFYVLIWNSASGTFSERIAEYFFEKSLFFSGIF